MHVRGGQWSALSRRRPLVCGFGPVLAEQRLARKGRSRVPKEGGKEGGWCYVTPDYGRVSNSALNVCARRASCCAPCRKKVPV